MPSTSSLLKSAPVFLITPEGIGVAVATLVDLSKSIAALKVLAPRAKTPSSNPWNVINEPRPDIGTSLPSM